MDLTESQSEPCILIENCSKKIRWGKLIFGNSSLSKTQTTTNTMDLIDSIQEYLLNCPQHISLWKGKTGAAMKTVDEIFAELASMKWCHFGRISYNCAEVLVFRDDPTHKYLNRMVTVTFIDLTNCDEDDFASEPPIEVVDLSDPLIIDLTE